MHKIMNIVYTLSQQDVLILKTNHIIAIGCQAILFESTVVHMLETILHVITTICSSYRIRNQKVACRPNWKRPRDALPIKITKPWSINFHICVRSPNKDCKVDTMKTILIQSITLTFGTQRDLSQRNCQLQVSQEKIKDVKASKTG